MNRFLTHFSIGCAMLTFAACSQDESDVSEPQRQGFVTFSTELTRATETAFESGDEIGVWAVKGSSLAASGNFADNVRYRYDGRQFNAVGDGIELQPEGLAYYASYPYQAGAQTEFDFTVKNDQTTHSALTASDLCTAYASSTTSRQVNLRFSHRLCRVLITLTGSNLTGSNATVRLSDVQTGVHAQLATLSFTGNGSNGDITMFAAGNNVYEAILAPQTLENGKKFIVVSVNGKETAFAASQTMTLTSGRQLQYTVDTDNGMVVAGDINPWYVDNGAPSTQIGQVTFSDTGLKFYVTACERVGKSLVIDFLVKNNTGKNLSNLRIYDLLFLDNYNGRLRDDVGGEYWNDLETGFGPFTRETSETYPYLAAGETLQGRIHKFGGFDNSDHAKFVSIHRGVSAENASFKDDAGNNAGYGILRLENIPITDNRPSVGVQTADRKLDVKVTSCTTDSWGDCTLSFSITNNSDEQLKNFYLDLQGFQQGESPELRDSEDNSYSGGNVERQNGDSYIVLSHMALQLNGSEWDYNHTVNIPAHATVNAKVIARDFSKTAKSITATIRCKTDTRKFEDAFIRFYDINVTR